MGENNDPNACRVWTEEGHSPDNVIVENEVAFFGAGCITGRIGCKWKEAKFEGNDIVVEGELSGRIGKVATLKDGQFIHLPHTGILASSVQKTFQKGETLEWKKDRVVLTTHHAAVAKKISGQDQSVINFMFSPICSKRDVAVGVGYLLAGRNQRQKAALPKSDCHLLVAHHCHQKVAGTFS